MKFKIIFKNYISKIFSAFVSLLLGFIVTPLLLKFLGKDDFALYKIANDWLNSVGIFEQALTGAMLVMLSNSKFIKKHVVTSSFIKYLKYSFLFIGIALVTSFFLPHFFQIPENKTRIVQYGFILGSLGFLCLPFGVFRIAIEHQEKSYLLSFLRVLQTLIQGILLVILAYLGSGIIGQFSGVLISNVLFSLATYLIFSKVIAKEERDMTLEKHIPEDKIQEAQDFKKSNIEALILSLASKISFYSDTLVLGFFVAPTSILPFSLSQRLIQLIQENLQSIGNSSWASLNQLYIEKKMDQFQYYLETLSKITTFIALTLLLPLILLNKSFISLWIGSEYYAGFFITLLAVINTSLMSLFSLWGWCLSGTGFIKEQVPIYVFNGVLNLIFSIFFTMKFGIVGPLLGTLSGFLLAYTWMIPSYLKRLLKLNPKPLINLLILNMAIILIFSGIAYKIEIDLNITSFLNLAIYYGVFSLILFFTLQFIILNHNDRKIFYDVLTKKIKQRIHPNK